MKEFAENPMMHPLVKDLDSWSQHIESLNLEHHSAVGAPALQKCSRGECASPMSTIPAGVLRHIGEWQRLLNPSAR